MYEGYAVAKSKTEISFSRRELIILLLATFMFGIVVAKAPQFIGLILLSGGVGISLLAVHKGRI